MDVIDVFIKIEKNGEQPVYASPQAAGCDLIASSDMIIRPGETVIIPLDITIALPEGTEAQIRPRSGLSLRTDLRLSNSPGTVDSDYRNPVGVIVQNTFNPALLPLKIASDPEIISTLNKYYRPVSLFNWLQENNPMDFNIPDSDDDAWQNFMNTTIFLDDQNNPYGTIYIKAGDRIAQMVIARHLKANFIKHDDPSSIGCDRGGGFGSTGTGAISK